MEKRGFDKTNASTLETESDDAADDGDDEKDQRISLATATGGSRETHSRKPTNWEKTSDFTVESSLLNLESSSTSISSFVDDRQFCVGSDPCESAGLSDSL